MELTFLETHETFETWLNKKFVSADLRDILSKASILMVPYENLRDSPNPYFFPTGTEDLLEYFKNKLPQEQMIDVCISDEYYQEFVFNCNYKRLGNFVVKAIAIPFFVSILASYVHDKYIRLDETKPQILIIDNSTHSAVNTHISTLTDKKYLEPTHIKFSVTVVDTTGKSKNISYEGPASEIDSVLMNLKEYEK
jgi:hypothetical protein